jgi:hypothetical protein
MRCPLPEQVNGGPFCILACPAPALGGVHEQVLLRFLSRFSTSFFFLVSSFIQPYLFAGDGAPFEPFTFKEEESS